MTTSPFIITSWSRGGGGGMPTRLGGFEQSGREGITPGGRPVGRGTTPPVDLVDLRNGEGEGVVTPP